MFGLWNNRASKVTLRRRRCIKIPNSTLKQLGTPFLAPVALIPRLDQLERLERAMKAKESQRELEGHLTDSSEAGGPELSEQCLGGLRVRRRRLPSHLFPLPHHRFEHCRAQAVTQTVPHRAVRRIVEPSASRSSRRTTSSSPAQPAPEQSPPLALHHGTDASPRRTHTNMPDTVLLMLCSPPLRVVGSSATSNGFRPILREGSAEHHALTTLWCGTRSSLVQVS